MNEINYSIYINDDVIELDAQDSIATIMTVLQESINCMYNHDIERYIKNN